MKTLTIIWIIAATVVWIGIFTLIKKLKDGKKAQDDLKKAEAELLDLANKLHQSNEEHKSTIQKKDQMLDKSNDLIHELEIKFQRAEEKYQSTVRQKDELYEHIKKNSNESIDYISSLIADHLTLQYEISATYLEEKKHPAFKEAQRIRELKAETKEAIQRNKILQYKYEFLFQLFPDLELYVDDMESISELSNLNNLEELKDATDRVRNFLSKEEYLRLQMDERNQLALDRYIKSQKTKWQIGRDYELFIGYTYANSGWDVEYFGIERQLEDMGRDLIARKGNEIHIVQCKYWAQQKLIHEKHIAQLYGTTVQFILSTLTTKKVVPVFATNISLSETARSFAKYLDVELIENKPMADFPRIKCNINRDEWGSETKIYHLPMDLQYDRTKICKEGERFAFTVQEAVNAGFRRAWRWHGIG